MTDVTNEYLRDAAVESVKAYLKDKKPLTDSVTQLALKDSLTGEQIRRVVETVNQVSYLKLLESAEDRTFEFPLASYEDVMAKILSPQEILEQDATESPMALMKQAFYEEELVKEAGEQGLDSLPESQRVALLYKQYQANERALEKVACDERALVEKLVGQAERCRGDAEFLDKVAFVTDGDDVVCRKLSKLVFGHVKKASGQDLFYEDDLKAAKELVGLLKKAEELVDKKTAMEASKATVGGWLKNKAGKAWGEVKTEGRTLVPSRVDLALGAAAYRPTYGIYSGLHKQPEGQ